MKAIFATCLAEEVGLRCRPLLIGSVMSSLYAPTRSAVGFGLERLPGLGRIQPNRLKITSASPQGTVRFQVDPVDRWVPRLHPRFLSVPPLNWMELGAESEGRACRWEVLGWLGR